MHETLALTTFVLFLLTVTFIVWRPRNLNESVPSSIGAVLLFLLGVVSLSDIYQILGVVSGASITILSTIVMSIVLESIGFFRWAAFNIVNKAKGSGYVLYWYINLLCFLMTLFFNNDGSILITTPIIIQIVTILKLKYKQKIPYLLSGALVATASSAPIGVSNLANLIALKIVGLDLNSYAAMMFVPSMIGIVAFSLVLFAYFKKTIPVHVPIFPPDYFTRLLSGDLDAKTVQRHHPLQSQIQATQPIDWGMFRLCITIVVLIRGSFFALSGLGIPIEWIAIFGALLLILIRWFRKGIGPTDILKKTPWHILIFAFSMYVIIYGLHNTGFTTLLVSHFRPYVAANPFSATLTMGFLLTVLSNVCNNLPAVMIGTLTLMEMGLSVHTMQVAYLANIIGSDIGSLMSPMGTLATLIWMFILRKNGIPITWGNYLRVTLLVIPFGLLVSLFSLYLWTHWLWAK